MDKGLNVTGPFNLLPKGTIVAFNGTTAPTGWAICDGKTVNGYKTPDLRGRFIRMHTAGKLSKDYDKFSMKAANRSDIKGYSRNDKVSYITKQNFSEYGGSDFVKMIESEMPSHKHSMDFNRSGTTNTTGEHYHNLSYNKNGWNGSRMQGTDRGHHGYRKTGNAGNHSHTFSVNIKGDTANKGGNNGHNNTPPYYV